MKHCDFTICVNSVISYLHHIIPEHCVTSSCGEISHDAPPLLQFSAWNWNARYSCSTNNHKIKFYPTLRCIILHYTILKFSRCIPSNTTRQILMKTHYIGDTFRLILQPFSGLMQTFKRTVITALGCRRHLLSMSVIKISIRVVVKILVITKLGITMKSNTDHCTWV
jgi:hypothetical protein